MVFELFLQSLGHSYTPWGILGAFRVFQGGLWGVPIVLGVFQWPLGCSGGLWGVPIVLGVFQWSLGFFKGSLGCSYNPWGGLWGVLVAL